jgi:hypothetical protein
MKDKNIYRSEEEQDPERPSDRRSSIYKDKSLFNPEARRRRSVDAEEEVADYHAVINGLAEPYDRFLWRGSVCISAAPGQRHATWHPVKIKLDTGSDLNIISSRVLQSLKYQSTYDDPQFKAAITLDSAHVQEFDKRVSLSFTFDLWPFTLYETFYVKEGAQIDVLIGHDTISAHDLVKIRQDVVDHLWLQNRTKQDRQKAEDSKRRAIGAADAERAAKLATTAPPQAVASPSTPPPLPAAPASPAPVPTTGAIASASGALPALASSPQSTPTTPTTPTAPPSSASATGTQFAPDLPAYNGSTTQPSSATATSSLHQSSQSSLQLSSVSSATQSSVSKPSAPPTSG